MDIRRRAQMGGIKKATSGGFNTDGSYTVNLNSQWELTTAVPNPDSTLYDGVYRSASNYHVHNSAAIMYITIKDCSSFTLYIRSYAESNYDYMMVSQLDKTITGSTSYYNTTLVKAHTRGKQQSGTALSNYTLVEFTGITPGEHTITVVYIKDSSANSGDDRGYVLIPKIDDEGDIEIDTTYSIQYTSSDGNIVTPSTNTVFGANIISNNYINGQGIISFDSPITTIGGSAFYYCNNLTSVNIPDSVTTIEYQAFYYCNNLTSVNIPNSITSIGGWSFGDCNNLTSVNIPNSVTTIGSSAFWSCDNLTSVTIPNSVTSIKESVFYNCKNLNEFKGKFASEDGRCLVVDGVLNSFAPYGLTEYTIPDSVTTIGERAFQECSSLTNITIPDSVTRIEYFAFYNCDSLTSVSIGDSVTTIGDQAFCACNNLTSVTIGDSVTKIVDWAFQGCPRLTSVYCKATTPPALGGTYVFNNNGSGRKIYVPTESVEAYKSATNWSEYADAIVGYNF